MENWNHSVWKLSDRCPNVLFFNNIFRGGGGNGLTKINERKGNDINRWCEFSYRWIEWSTSGTSFWHSKISNHQNIQEWPIIRRCQSVRSIITCKICAKKIAAREVSIARQSGIYDLGKGWWMWTKLWWFFKAENASQMWIMDSKDLTDSSNKTAQVALDWAADCALERSFGFEMWLRHWWKFFVSASVCVFKESKWWLYEIMIMVVHN